MKKFIKSRGSLATHEIIREQVVTYGNCNGNPYTKSIINEWLLGNDNHYEEITYDDGEVSNIYWKVNGKPTRQNSYFVTKNGWTLSESCVYGTTGINTMTFGEIGTENHNGMLIYSKDIMIGYYNIDGKYQPINGSDDHTIWKWQEKLGIYSDSLLNIFT